MIYHLNVNVGKQLTGIESAAIQRHQLLNEKGNSKLVTMRHNLKLKENMALYGLGTEDYINMYDFFQESTHLEKRTKLLLTDIFQKEDVHFEKVTSANDYRVFYKERYVAYVHLDDQDTVAYINYFDQDRKKRKRQLYDSRGFLSIELLLGQDQKVLAETYYSPKGERKIEKFYHYEQLRKVTLIHVYEKNDVSILENEEDLMTLFLKRLLTKEDVAICDKNILIAASLIQVSNVGKKIAVLHSKHYSGTDPMEGAVSAPYRTVFANLDQFDYVICSTTQQQQDLWRRFGKKKMFVCIPVGIRKEVSRNELKVKEETVIRIGVVARYYAEKRLDHVIQAFNKLHATLPNTELHLFGFGDSREKFKTEKELIQQTNRLNLTEAVKFRGYLVDLSEEYKKMHMILLTSSYEGFCLALLEGISYGIPAVSYDINYGPKEMIDSENSGYLIPDGDIEELADKVIEILQTPSKYEKFSNNSFERSKKFSKENIKSKWESLLL